MTDKIDVSAFGELIRESDKLRLMNVQSHFEFFDHELKAGDEEETATEGLFLSHLNLREIDKVGLKLAKDYGAVEFLNKRELGSAFKNISKSAIEHSAGIGVVSVDKLDNRSLIEAGISFERLWLLATNMNIGIHPITGLSVLCCAYDRNDRKYFSNAEFEKIGGLASKAKSIVGSDASLTPVLIFRIHHAKSDELRSRRRPLSDVLIIK
ncbi:MAG: hypothetical protein JNM00_09095 [Flavobacteriales bacterium]|nr:hypothetical protein [Flavobacteriales bacterium]